MMKEVTAGPNRETRTSSQGSPRESSTSNHKGKYRPKQLENKTGETSNMQCMTDTTAA